MKAVEKLKKLLKQLEKQRVGLPTNPVILPNMGDQDTGFYQSADDEILFVVGGEAKWTMKDPYRIV